MSLPKTAALIFLLATVFSLTANAQVLQPYCSAQADSNGFIELLATAGYHDERGNLFCYDTAVTVTIAGVQYQMNKFYECSFSKLVQLPMGEYNASFYATMPNSLSANASCLFNITASSGPQINAFLPKDGAQYALGAQLQVEASAVQGRETLFAGTMTAKLDNQTIPLVRDANGVWKGATILNEIGEFQATLFFDYGNWHVEKTLSVTVVSGLPQQNASKPPALRINVINPVDKRIYSPNQALQLQAEVLDANDFVVQKANATATIYFGPDTESDPIATLPLSEFSYYYRASFLFSNEGTYTIVFNAAKQQFEASNTIQIFVASKLSSAANFSIQFILPHSGVYPENAQLNVRVSAQKDAAPVTNATVSVFITQLSGNQSAPTQLLLEYDSNHADYAAALGPLDTGQYELRAVGMYNQLISEDKIIFSVSKHGLSLMLNSPTSGEKIKAKKTDPVQVKADVRDENSQIVDGALVIAKIKAPSGASFEAQLFQNPSTGEYSTEFYPSQSGTHTISLEAAKPDLLSATLQSSFTAEIDQGLLPFKLDWQSVLTVILIIAIAILLAALLHGFRF